MRPVAKTLLAVGDGIASLTDRDFSVSISAADQPELAALVEGYNRLGSVLREERQSLYQRELLLDTVIQATPLSMVLTNANGRVVYSNVAARQTFLGGRKLEGLAFAELLAASPEPLRQAVATEADTLFTIEGPRRIGDLPSLAARLPAQQSAASPVPAEADDARAGAAGSRDVEESHPRHRARAQQFARADFLAGSLRPPTVERPDAAQLERIFRTIEDRARHLHSFIDGYARFAKLPRPQPEEIDWPAFLRSLQETAPFNVASEPPTRPGVFDPAQMEQVIINLVKNAKEAGAPPDSIELHVQEHAAGWRLQLLDRGAGMSEEVLRNALLPFYSTKPSGAGLGLTLCREVIEAHGGRISLANRPGGGLAATLWIPAITLD